MKELSSPIAFNEREYVVLDYTIDEAMPYFTDESIEDYFDDENIETEDFSIIVLREDGKQFAFHQEDERHGEKSGEVIELADEDYYVDRNLYHALFWDFLCTNRVVLNDAHVETSPVADNPDDSYEDILFAGRRPSIIVSDSEGLLSVDIDEDDPFRGILKATEGDYELATLIVGCNYVYSHNGISYYWD